MCGPSRDDEWMFPPRLWGWLALFAVGVGVWAWALVENVRKLIG